MGIWIRGLAIGVEVVVLGGLLYYFLGGSLLALLDLGIPRRYERAIVLLLAAVAALVGSFYVAHITFYYPPAP